MADKKGITIRVSDEEFAHYEALTVKYGITRTKMIKNALAQYEHGKNVKPLQARAQEVVSPAVVIADYSHPLLSKINKEGIEVYDDDSNVVSTIENLTDLLNFVSLKVFRNAKVSFNTFNTGSVSRSVGSKSKKSLTVFIVFFVLLIIVFALWVGEQAKKKKTVPVTPITDFDRDSLGNVILYSGV